MVNELEDEGTAIHWHGLRMEGANAMDGVVGLTQSAIPSAASMTYDFGLDDNQCGTFWYHAHSELQRADGLYGGLIIHCGYQDRELVSSPPAGEQLLMIGDWYHQAAWQTLEWYTRPAAAPNEPVPDSLLVNGIGVFDCLRAAPARPIVCSQTEPPHLFLSTGQKTLLRVVNVGSMAGVSLSIKGAKLRVTHIDGGNEIQAVSADSVGVLYPGERADIIVDWQDCEAYQSLLEIAMDDENFRYRNPTLKATQAFPIDLSKTDQCYYPSESATLTESQDFFDLQTAISVSQLPEPLESTDTIFVLYAKTMQLTHLENRPLGFMNHSSWKPQSVPLSQLPRSDWNTDQLVPWVGSFLDTTGKPRWVDIVLNNIDDGGHPFHLHGNDFYVLKTFQSGRNWGSWNPFETGVKESPGGFLELDSPRKKDTVFVPRHGYAVLRFLADNPGIWAFHCHIIWHQATGMAMGFQVGGHENGLG